MYQRKGLILRINLHLKITLLFVLIVAIILLGAYVYLNNILREQSYQRIKEDLTKNIYLARSYVEYYLKKKASVREIDALADSIGKDLGVRVTIIEPDGVVAGDSQQSPEQLKVLENHLYRPEVQQALKEKLGTSRRFSTTVQKDMLYIATLFGDREPYSFIRLSVPLSEINEITSRLKGTLIVCLLIAFGASVIIGFVASAFISNPIEEVSQVSKNIAEGDLSQKIYIRSNDEIGDLASAFNEMSDRFRSMIAELELGKSRLEAVFLSMFEGVVVVDTTGTILLMNQRLKEFLNVIEDPIGKKPLEVIRNIEVQDIINNVLSIKKGIESKEITVLLEEEKILSVNATPIVLNGKIEGAVLVFHDITALRRLEDVRRDFIANVSHELRTPISSIKGYAETLLSGALSEKKNAKDFVDIIYKDSDRLARLIEDLLDLSKIESGKMKMNIKPCHIATIVEKVVSGMNKQIKEKSLKVNIEIPSGLPKVLADEARMGQVVLNLIDNAIKYTHTNDSITIKAYPEGQFVKVDVTDTGIGIPEEALSRIFERFYRVDKGRSRELGGTGLGLSIVKNIIQAHQGQVSVSSAWGKGSTFSFTLPKA